MLDPKFILESFLEKETDLIYLIDLATKEIKYFFSNHYQFIGYKYFPKDGNKLSFLYSNMEILSQSLFDKIINSSIEFDGEKFEYNLLNNRKNKITFLGKFVKTTELNSILVFSKNITKAKKKEEKYFKEETRLKAILDNTVQYYFFLDKSFKILYMNSKAKTFFSNALGQNLFEGYPLIEYLPVEDMEKFLSCFDHTFEGNNMNYETSIFFPDRSRGWFEFTFLPVIENGEISSICLSMLNITERKNNLDRLNALNFELIELNKSLEKRVNERTKELMEENKTRKLAEEKLILSLEKEKELNEMKSKFISIVSHEFRNPMTIISASTQLLSNYGEKYTVEERNKHLNKITEAISSLTNLMESVLKASMSEKQIIQVNKEEFELIPFCENIISKFELINNNFEFIKNINIDKNTIIKLDKNLFSLILENLISNAIKYSKNIKRIELSLSKLKNNHFEIVVKDYGIGIPYEDQSYITNNFFRAKNALNIKGTGVGLNIVKNFVEIQDGELFFNSIPDLGTEFHIVFPE